MLKPSNGYSNHWKTNSACECIMTSCTLPRSVTVHFLFGLANCDWPRFSLTPSFPSFISHLRNLDPNKSVTLFAVCTGRQFRGEKLSVPWRFAISAKEELNESPNAARKGRWRIASLNIPWKEYAKLGRKIATSRGSTRPFNTNFLNG